MKYSESLCEIFQPDATTRLASHIWLPEGKPRAIFIAVHGGMAYAGDWMETALYFKTKGIATYAPDLRWHGDFPNHNPGEKNFFHIDSYDTYVRDIDLYCRDIKRKHPGVPVFILSHSNGALISLCYGLKYGRNAGLAGMIMSSPWLVNRVKVPRVMKAAARIIAMIYPRFEVTPKPVTDHLTHDAGITARHHADEISGVRGTTASAGLAVASEKAQQFVLDTMASWDAAPILGIIAGQDMLADPQPSESALKSVTNQDVDVLYYHANFHENFNEVNREEIWERTWDWVRDKL